MDKDTVVIIIGFLGVIAQLYFKDRADNRRAQQLDLGLKETANIADQKAADLARVTAGQTERLVGKIVETKQAIDENTAVSTGAFDAANHAKEAIAETNRVVAEVANQAIVKSSEQSDESLHQVIKDLAELKELIKRSIV